MTARLPLVCVAGQIQQLQNGDTLSANASGALAQANNLSDVASQGLAVANLQPATAAPTASASLLRAAAEQDQYATGTITLTMPNGGAGWRSGIVVNDNALSGLVTLAVPSGATLDGVTNGTTVLRPFQRARIRQTGATAYRTVWVDPTPVVASARITSAVTAVALALPAGYGCYEVRVAGLRPDTAAATLGALFSTNGGSSFLTGTNFYNNTTMYLQAGQTTANGSSGGASFIEVAYSMATGGPGYTGSGLIFPGSASDYPSLQLTGGHMANSGLITERSTFSYYTAQATINAFEFYLSSGNIVAGAIAVRGVA